MEGLVSKDKKFVFAALEGGEPRGGLIKGDAVARVMCQENELSSTILSGV